MKTLNFTLIIFAVVTFASMNEAAAQWNTSGNNIYNTNSANVGIGNSSPTTLLYVAKNMTEPAITVQNLGGFGGATYVMTDNVSGANWKFKATTTGGFKIRDHANLLDVIVIEPNSSANVLYINGAGSLGITTASPAASAAVDISSTNKGFLIPRLTLSQIQSISEPADGLQVFCTTDGKIYLYVSPESQWKEVAYGTGTIAPPFTCGSPITKNHIAGNVAPVTKSVTYGTVNNIPGETSKCWITSNLGADHQATAVSDATEASAGWHWQFNRKQGYKHDGTTRTPNTTWIATIDENLEWQTANDPCALELGAGWRIPTSTEWTNVDASGNWTDWNGSWNSGLKLHAAGYLFDQNGSLRDSGIDGDYWSSTQYNSSKSSCLNIYNVNSIMYNNFKSYGFSLRCIKD